MIELKYYKNKKENDLHQKIKKFTKDFTHNFISKYTSGIREKRDFINGHCFVMLDFYVDQVLNAKTDEEVKECFSEIWDYTYYNIEKNNDLRKFILQEANNNRTPNYNFIENPPEKQTSYLEIIMYENTCLFAYEDHDYTCKTNSYHFLSQFNNSKNEIQTLPILMASVNDASRNLISYQLSKNNHFINILKKMFYEMDEQETRLIYAPEPIIENFSMHQKMDYGIQRKEFHKMDLKKFLYENNTEYKDTFDSKKEIKKEDIESTYVTFFENLLFFERQNNCAMIYGQAHESNKHLIDIPIPYLILSFSE